MSGPQQQPPPWGAPQQPPQQQWSQQPPPPPPGWGAPPAPGWGAPPEGYSQGTSLWAIIAGVCLLIWGLLWTLVGVGALLIRGAFDSVPGLPSNIDFDEVFAVIGIVVLVIGILHLLAAIFIWAHRSWARYLGLVLAVLGTLLGVLSLPAAFAPASSDAGSSGIVGTLMLLVPYAIALVGLIIGGNHFARRYG